MTDTPLREMLDPVANSESQDSESQHTEKQDTEKQDTEPVDTLDGFDDIELEDPRPARRLSLLTSTLLACLLVAAAFGAGALVYKHLNSTPVATARGGGAGAFAALAGQFPGGAAALAGGAAGAGATAGGAGTAAAGGSSTGTIAAVGHVVTIHGTTLTLQNLGGKTVIVRVPVGTPITTAATATGPGGLAVGATVSVTGTTAADGAVTATAVVAR